MAKYTLQEVLDSTSKLSSGMQVSNSLIPEMEVVGYINSAQIDNLMQQGGSLSSFAAIVNHAVSGQVVCSNYLFQMMDDPSHFKTQSIGKLFPIYKRLKLSDSELDINIEQLEIPSLYENSLYKRIKARIGTGVEVFEHEFRKSNMPDNIHLEEGKAMFHVAKGAILCYDRHNSCRGVGENILALCRYVHAATGNVCYAQFDLSDVYMTTEIAPTI